MKIRRLATIVLLAGALGAVQARADALTHTPADSRTNASTNAPTNAPTQPLTTGAPPAQASAQLIAQGRYLAGAADCVACHTAKGGQPFAGGLGIASPVGVIYSSNITPDKATGIGDYSLEDFDRAVRRGIAKDGTTLYPAMPYASYARLTPTDVGALYAYFRHEVAPVSQTNRATGIVWPLSMRWPLRFWRMTFAPEPVANTDAAISGAQRVARGRYLVEGAAHCGACHTPRGLGLQEKALSDDGRYFLSGGVVDGYVAKNLRGDRQDGLGAWSEDDIVAFLKGGRSAHAAAFGGMSEVVERSTQYMSDADLAAIAAYLKTLTPVREGAAALVPDASAAQKLRAGTARGNGALTYVDNCAACHRTSGSGYSQTFPALALSSVVNGADPTSLVHLVLQGGQMPSTKAAPTHYGMPGFASRLTDRDIADVLTFVRSSWGNRAAAVSADQVASIRKAVGAAPAPRRAENP